MKPINIFDYETLAMERLDVPAWDFYNGGSEDEVTVRANRSAFERIRLRPRVLVNVSACDLQTSVRGDLRTYSETTDKIRDASCLEGHSYAV